MNRDREQEREEVLREKKDLHRKDEIEEYCRECDAPSHWRSRHRHEQYVGCEPSISLAHGSHSEHAAHPGHDLRCAKRNSDADHGTDRPTPRNPIGHRHAA